MSKIAIVSDSHGSIENIALFEKRLKGVDALWHLGDHAEDAELLQAPEVEIDKREREQGTNRQ